MFFALYVLIYAALNTAGLLLLRVGLKDKSGGSGLVHVVTRPHVIIGLVLYGLGFVTWLASLRQYPLTVVYPVFVGVSYVSVLAGSVVILHESLSSLNVVGVTLIAGGVLLVVR
jgi:drug/metabolite transporter (DMT)-like permease